MLYYFIEQELSSADEETLFMDCRKRVHKNSIEFQPNKKKDVQKSLTEQRAKDSSQLKQNNY